VITKPQAALSLLAVLLASTAPAVVEAASGSRRFEVVYEVTIDPPEFTSRLEAWIPAPTTSTSQFVGHLKIEADVHPRLTVEPAHKNGMMYLESLGPFDAPVSARLSYEIERLEYHGRYAALPDIRFLTPAALAPLDGVVAELAEKATHGRNGALAKARGIYSYITGTLHHDSATAGSGRGDVVLACDKKAGDSSDFNGLFVAMARSAGIPARFHVGFALDPMASRGTLAQPYAWAQFYVDDKGWIPVDTFAGRVSTGKRASYFGAIDHDRFELSTGRDIMLSPPQSGAALNFFALPYVEIDNKPIEEHWRVRTRITFEQR